MNILLILFLIPFARSITTVTLLPSLCGAVVAPATGQIIKVEAGPSAFMEEISNCSYVMQATETGHQLSFGFGTGHDEENSITSSNCTEPIVRVLDSDGMTTLIEQSCGILPNTQVISSGNNLTLIVNSLGGNGTILNFTAHYTSFTTGGHCADFPCANGRCVDPEGRCDVTLINNCGDFSDNSRGDPGNCSVEEPTPTTVPVMTEPIPSNATSAPAIPSSPGNLLWIAWLALGLAGGYFIYWLLWRPGYLVWRCACWRHLSCCRKHGCCQRTAPRGGKLTGRWFSCCGESAGDTSKAGDGMKSSQSTGGTASSTAPQHTGGSKLPVIPESGAVGWSGNAGTDSFRNVGALNGAHNSVNSPFGGFNGWGASGGAGAGDPAGTVGMGFAGAGGGALAGGTTGGFRSSVRREHDHPSLRTSQLSRERHIFARPSTITPLPK